MTEQIQRIKKMEFYFDTLLRAHRIDPDWIRKEVPLRQMLDDLLFYYDNGLWLTDYQADERGELPSDLKRGVLSEDGVYNFLSELPSL